MKPVQRFGIWLFAAAVVVYCFWPALTVEYGFHNDYVECRRQKAAVFFRHPESAHLMAIGRPLGAILLNLHFYPIRGISDFTLARWFTVAVILLSAWLLARRLERREHGSRAVAICAAIAVFLLPSSQVFVCWVSNCVPGALNTLLALVCYELLDRVALSGWRDNPRRWLEASGWLLSAGLLFLGSMCIYPPTALFILVPTFCGVVLSPIEQWPQTRRRVLRDVVFTLVGIGAYFVFMRHIGRPIMAHYSSAVRNAIAWTQSQGRYQFSVEPDVLVALKNYWKLLSVALEGALHPLMSEPTAMKAAWAIAIAWVLVGLWCLVRRPTASETISASGQRGYFLQACLAGITLIAISECPCILAVGAAGFAPYRVVYPASAMVLLLFFSIVGRCWPILPETGSVFLARLAPAVLLAGCVLLGHANMRNVVANAHTELVFFRQQLDRLDLRSVKAIHVVARPTGVCFVESPLRGEFSLSATNGPGARNFLNALLEERGLPAGKVRLHWTAYDPAADHSLAMGGCAVIDMNLATASPRFPARPVAMVRASPEEAASDPLYAFDQTGTSWWEFGRLPQWIEVAYDQPYPVAEYTLGSVTPVERTPLDWQMFGSDDGAHWTLIDQRAGQRWAINQSRTFLLEKAARFCRYRLMFTAADAGLIRLRGLSLGHPGSGQVAGRSQAAPR